VTVDVLEREAAVGTQADAVRVTLVEDEPCKLISFVKQFNETVNSSTPISRVIVAYPDSPDPRDEKYRADSTLLREKLPGIEVTRITGVGEGLSLLRDIARRETKTVFLMDYFLGELVYWDDRAATDLADKFVDGDQPWKDRVFVYTRWEGATTEQAKERFQANFIPAAVDTNSGLEIWPQVGQSRKFSRVLQALGRLEPGS